MQFFVQDFVLAEKRVKKVIDSSPLIFSPWISEILDAEVYLKLECLNPGNSFKIRGASNALLAKEKLPKKVITASGGNHGLGVAIAAKILKIPATIFLPTSTSLHRIKLLKEQNADVQLFGESFDEADSHARQIAEKEGALYIHAFADLSVIQGQGTIAREILKQLPEVDAILVSVGGGGLITGISRCLDAHKRDDVEIYAVETEGADCLNRSIKQGELVTLEKIESIAKTLGARRTTKEIFEYLKNRVTKSVVVSDKDAVEAMREFLNHEKLIIEPAASCIVSAILKRKFDLKGKKVVIVVCGSNITIEEFEKWSKEFDISVPKNR